MKYRYVTSRFECQDRARYEEVKEKSLREHLERLKREGCEEIKTRVTKRVYGDYEIVSLCRSE
jgi:hypothetical protein